MKRKEVEVQCALNMITANWLIGLCAKLNDDAVTRYRKLQHQFACLQCRRQYHCIDIMTAPQWTRSLLN
jgi:hypothetical protein